jgi:hypothetical protein
MTKEQVEAKIRAILNKDPIYKDAKIYVKFSDKITKHIGKAETHSDRC